MTQNIDFSERARSFFRVLQQRPFAVADVRGSEEYQALHGEVYFYQTAVGVLVAAQILGLPAADSPCHESVFAFHIHSGDSCSGDQDDPFKNVLTHYNPGGCTHPNHAGDLIPLFGNQGYAFEIFLTDRFSVNEIVGKTVVIHSNPDDFTTQPSGNAGKKIACGEIVKCRACDFSHSCGDHDRF